MTFFAQKLFFLSRQSIKQKEREKLSRSTAKKRGIAVIEARKAGLTIAQIAVQTGVGQTTVKA